MALLTEKQLRTPNRSVPEALARNGKLSLLERSFFRLDWEQLNQWRQLNAITQAMRNPRHPRYTHSLMDALLAPRRFHGVLSASTHEQWSQACRELWELGAKDHPERYDRWLACAMHLDFADTLLDAGANPHHDKISNNEGLPGLFAALSNYQVAVAFPSPFRKSDFRQEEGRLFQERIERCLRYPIKNVNQLDRYLDLLSQHAASAPPGDEGVWRSWRDQLMAQGATPSPHTLARMVSSISIAHARPGRNKDEEFKLQIQRWQDGVHEWLDASLPRMPKDWQLPGHAWSELLERTGGEAIAAKCLQGGTRPCWQPLPNEFGPYVVPFVGYHTRSPEALEMFTRLHALAPATPQWLAQATSAYLSKNYATSTHGPMVSAKEISLLLSLHGWLPGQALPDPIQSWFNRLPQYWQSNLINEESRRALLEDLGGLGVLSAAMGYPGTPQGSSAASTHHVLYSRWSQSPPDVQLLAELLPPSTHADLMVNMAVGNLEWEAGPNALPWIRQSMALDPGACARILGVFLPSTREELSKMGAPKIRKLFRVQSLLLSCGHPAPVGEQALDWMRQAVSLIGAGSPAQEQVQWVQDMVRAGLDLNTNNAALLSEILAGEAQRFPNHPAGANYLEPLVSALLQEGVDPSLVDADLRSTHCLASQVLRARLEHLTASAPKALQRASRL